jgi:hypothetical protein
MDKKGNKENIVSSSKLTWEAPKLICLDKGKTEGGETYNVTKEDTSYQVS